MCGLMSDLVIASFKKSMATHDTECPSWDQMSLNNTNQTKLTVGSLYYDVVVKPSHLLDHTNPKCEETDYNVLYCYVCKLSLHTWGSCDQGGCSPTVFAPTTAYLLVPIGVKPVPTLYSDTFVYNDYHLHIACLSTGKRHFKNTTLWSLTTRQLPNKRLHGMRAHSDARMDPAWRGCHLPGCGHTCDEDNDTMRKE